MKFVYSVDAVEDLARLREFIELHNPVKVKHAAGKLPQGISLLIENPEIGRPVTKAHDPELVRDIIISDYIVRYILSKRTIVVLRVWHHREDRDISPMLG